MGGFGRRARAFRGDGDCTDRQNQQSQEENGEVVDEDRQLVRQETEMVLYGILARSRHLAQPIIGQRQFNVDWIIQADSHEARFSDSHRPAHTLDCDFFDSAREFTVLDLAVIMVIA